MIPEGTVIRCEDAPWLAEMPPLDQSHGSRGAWVINNTAYVCTIASVSMDASLRVMTGERTKSPCGAGHHQLNCPLSRITRGAIRDRIALSVITERRSNTQPEA